jgi:mxaJ protein
MGHRRRAVAALGGAIATLTAVAAEARTLRVCADPNNLPFSNQRREGFENKLVELIAADLGAKLEYVWRAQRRGVVRDGLNGGECDLIPGVATAVEMLATTRPYYRSSYMFVTRADARLDIASLDDERLRELKVGVQLVGDDGSNTPPAHALARRGIVGNVRGYMLYGNYEEANPPARIVEAVASGEIDVALVWGPLAGWAAKSSAVPLALAPVTPWLDGPQWPMVFDVSIGLRRSDRKLRSEIETVLAARRSEIETLLAGHGVPLLADARAQPSAPR